MSILRCLGAPKIFFFEINPINYCRANQEWQWRNILFTIAKSNINITYHFIKRESIDHLCINPILWIELIHKWFIDYKFLITL